MHFDLTDLRLFAAVVEEGSITAGASRAAISLPSASARVKGMEEALGTALLERHRRGVRPTPAGAALCHHAQLVLAQMERLRGDLREHARGGVRGHVRLMSNTTALEEYLPDVLAGWLARNPGVDIALEVEEARIAVETDDLQAEYARLVGEGVEFLSEPQKLRRPDRTIWFAVFKDPDGNFLELYQYTLTAPQS